MFRNLLEFSNKHKPHRLVALCEVLKVTVPLASWGLFVIVFFTYSNLISEATTKPERLAVVLQSCVALPWISIKCKPKYAAMRNFWCCTLKTFNKDYELFKAARLSRVFIYEKKLVILENTSSTSTQITESILKSNITSKFQHFAVKIEKIQWNFSVTSTYILSYWTSFFSSIFFCSFWSKWHENLCNPCPYYVK